MDGLKGIGSLKGITSLQQFRYMLQAIQDVRSGKVAREDAIEQTILRYKLDLDERGVLKSAKPGDSQRAVTNQEQTNIRRLSAEAMAQGEDVVSVDVDYKAAIVDGKLAIVAGRTEVTSLKNEEAPDAAAPTGGPAPAAGAAVDDYNRIGAANRDAAASGRLLDLDDDATMRSISGGLEPVE